MGFSRIHVSWLAAVLPLGALVVGASAAPPAKQDSAKKPAQTAASVDRDVLAFGKKYCFGCHQGDTPSAGVSLAEYKTEAEMLKARNLWERVSNTVGSKHMPPVGMPAPTSTERAAFVDYLQSAISRADCAIKTPGRVTLRRLNRAEYNNTVRDLLGVPNRPADDFPSDDVGYGFDNIGDVLSISPLLLEKYLGAARKVAQAALYAPEDKITAQTVRFAASQLSGDGGPDGNGHILFSNGSCGAEYNFPGPGTYMLRVVAYQQQAGPDAAKMSFIVGDKSLREIQVRARESNPTLYEFKYEADKPGKQRVAVSFNNDYYNPDSTDPKLKGDRNLIIQSIEVVPKAVSIADPTEFPAFQHRLNRLQPAPGPDGVVGEKAMDTSTQKFLAYFLPRAFRRPATRAEIDRYAQLASRVRKAGNSFEKSWQVAIQATLVSPQFLFMVEPTPPPGQKQRPLNDYELATRLSYFIWSSAPDDRLYSLAAKGKLKDPNVLSAEAKRMLTDPRAKALADNFAGQWLNLRKLSIVSPDPQKFPNFNEALRNAMRTETDMFFMNVVKEDRPILDFLSSDYTFLNETLAKHYGNADIKGDAFRKVKLGGNQRGGLLTQASILTITSNPTRTSPVKRGKWVMENILGTPPPPPPPNVPELPDDKKGPLTGTLRQRLEQHRANPACASCHKGMDNIGFGLETFDAIGTWRTTDGDSKIDTSATMPDGQSFNGAAGLKNYLLGQKGHFTRAFTEKVLTYGLGRGMEPYDRCNLETMAQEVAKNGYKFSAVVTAVVTSEPFRFRASGQMPAMEQKKPAPSVKPAAKKKVATIGRN